MTESIIDHWSNTACREVLEQLLAEEKGRCCTLFKPIGQAEKTFQANFSFCAGHISKYFQTESKAQAWLDQQWKDYVEGMRTVQSPETIPCRLCNGTGKRMVVYRKKLTEWECCDCKGEGRLPVLPNRP